MKPDEEILAFLLKLNLELADKEPRRETIAHSGQRTIASNKPEYISQDCVRIPQFDDVRLNWRIRVQSSINWPSIMSEQFLYKKPPIVERVIAAYKRIPHDDFEKKLPSWVEKIRHEFPVEQHFAEWKIDIEDKNGVPFVKSLEPKARIIRLYWQKHKTHRHVIGMRVRPDRLVFHLCREENNPHEFAELLPYMEQWLPRWAEHFGINEIDGVTVEYYNVLDGNITPQFASQDGVRVGEALTVFSNFPGVHQGITSPYDCKVRLIVDKDKPSWFDLRVRADDRSAAAVRVDFEVLTFPEKNRLSFSQSLAEIVSGHEVLLKQFSCIFTELAKSSFL